MKFSWTLFKFENNWIYFQILDDKKVSKNYDFKSAAYLERTDELQLDCDGGHDAGRGVGPRHGRHLQVGLPRHRHHAARRSHHSELVLRVWGGIFTLQMLWGRYSRKGSEIKEFLASLSGLVWHFGNGLELGGKREKRWEILRNPFIRNTLL